MTSRVEVATVAECSGEIATLEKLKEATGVSASAYSY
jgi:hypothetical protein